MRLLLRKGQSAATAQVILEGATAHPLILEGTTAHPRHHFWPDDVPYTEVPVQPIIGHRQVAHKAPPSGPSTKQYAV